MKLLQKYLPYLLIGIVLLFVGRCSKGSGDPSLRKILKDQKDSLEVLKAERETHIKQLQIQDRVISQSHKREQILNQTIYQVERKRELDKARFEVEQRSWQKELSNATDQELAETMTTDYIKKVESLGSQPSRTGIGSSIDSVLDNKDNQLILTGQVIISRQVAAWHIYERRFKERLLSDNGTLDSILTLWERRGAEWALQRKNYEASQSDFKAISELKDKEITLITETQEKLLRKAKKYRRQRNLVILGSGVILGGITYLVFK